MNEKQLDYHEVMARQNEVLFKKEIIILLDDLRLPPNIAGIFRLCDGLQVSKIILLSEDEIAFSKKFRSIARLHEQHLNYEILKEQQAISEIQKLKEEHYHVSALEYTSSSKDLPALKKSDKHLLIAGSEKYGIRQSLLDLTEQCVHIPMQGKISSLNVMQAVSIAIYEIRRRELIISQS